MRTHIVTFSVYLFGGSAGRFLMHPYIFVYKVTMHNQKSEFEQELCIMEQT